MSEEIIKVLDALAEKFGLAIDWTSQNIIPYLEQLCGKYVTYEIVTSVMWMLFGIICLFIGKWGVKKTQYCYKKYQERVHSDWDIGAVLTGIGTGIVILTGIFVIMGQLLDLATCFTFPEKIILEELKSIYTSMNQ